MRKEYSEKLDTSKILFSDIQPELFNSIAKSAAKTVESNKKSNKPTQIRKFYDEIVMWDLKVSSNSDKFKAYHPLILMMNAKAAYAEGRKLIDKNFSTLIEHCLKQVNTPESMNTFKLFMEAFMGFYKQLRPKD